MFDLAYPAVVRAAVRLSTQGTGHLDPYLSIILEEHGLVSLCYPGHVTVLLNDHPLAKVSSTSRSNFTVTPSWSSLWCERGEQHQVLSAPSLVGCCFYPFYLTLCREVGSEDVFRLMWQLGFLLLIMNLLISSFASLKPSRLIKKLQPRYVLIKYVEPLVEAVQ